MLEGLHSCDADRQHGTLLDALLLARALHEGTQGIFDQRVAGSSVECPEGVSGLSADEELENREELCGGPAQIPSALRAVGHVLTRGQQQRYQRPTSPTPPQTAS